MKNKLIMPIRKLLLLLVMAATFQACTDLELQPLSTAAPDVLFQDEDAYRSFLARVYAGLAITGQSGPTGSADITSLDEGFSNYLRQYWQLQTLTTEEAVIGWGDAGLPELHNHTWTSENQFVRAMYYRIFFQVSMANEFLRESTDDKLTARAIPASFNEDIARFRAEARFLRALAYYHGMDLYGSIPFYTEEQAIGGTPPSQVDRQAIFNFIESELTAIENQMAAPGENQYGRADRAALWMLQAKLYLNAEVYIGTDRSADALSAAVKVIDSGIYSLEEDYRFNYMADNHNSREIIFAIPFDGDNTQTWGGLTYLVHAAIGGNMDPAFYGVNNGWGGLRTTSGLVNNFPDPTGATDERALFYSDGQNLEIANISSFTDGYALPKYTNVTSEGVGGVDLNFPDTDYPMFRLADAYLMYAEAQLRSSTGSRDLALQYVNELRSRAWNGTAGNIADGELDLGYILDERSRELYWEGHRRTDLIRFNRFTENGVWPWKGGVPEGQVTESFRNVFPLPASELLANPNLRQNSGY